jgi:hypothetical protein
MPTGHIVGIAVAVLFTVLVIVVMVVLIAQTKMELGTSDKVHVVVAGEREAAQDPASSAMALTLRSI